MKKLFGKMRRFSRPAVRRRARPSGNPVAAVESLEDRVLLSSVSVAGGTLVINGTSGVDGVWVNEAGGDIRVRISEGSQTVSVENYSGAEVNKLRINGRAGDDQIINKTDMFDTIIGGAGNDILFGGGGGGLVFGGEGDDLILGGAGNDFLSGGAGNDGILGGTGRDTLRGGAGNDRLFGEADVDRILGGAENDFIRGGAGNDHLFGEAGIDRIRGEAGIDRINGGDDEDRLLGQEEADLIFGGAGDDIIVGGVGDDILIGGSKPGDANGGSDIIIGGPGDNLVVGGDGGDGAEIGPPGPGTIELPETAGESPGADMPNFSDVEQSIIDQTNDFRGDEGKSPVAESATLNEVAQDFADYMVENNLYGHQADGRTPAERVSAAGYDYGVVRENIAYQFFSAGFTTQELADAFVTGWINSTGHRTNMLAEDITQTGVAIAKTDDSDIYVAVQVFARPA